MNESIWIERNIQTPWHAAYNERAHSMSIYLVPIVYHKLVRTNIRALKISSQTSRKKDEYQTGSAQYNQSYNKSVPMTR